VATIYIRYVQLAIYRTMYTLFFNSSLDLP